MGQHDTEQDLLSKLKEEWVKMGGKRPNVLVAGYTGSGKTSLIQAICGDLVPDEAIGSADATTVGFDEYANDYIRVWDSKGLQPGEAEAEFLNTMRGFIDARQRDSQPDEHVHLVWYTVQGPGARVTDCDLALIQDVFDPKHVIVAITKADVTRPEQIAALMTRLTDAGVPEDKIVITSDRRSGATGCEELMELTRAMLPEAYGDSFVEGQRVDRRARLDVICNKAGKAKAVIATASAAAAGIGAIPIPIADAALLIPTQMAMIARLAVLYGLREEAVRDLALPFVARVVGVYGASSLLKLLPGLGSLINAGVAGTLTGAMGWYTQTRFEAVAMAKVRGVPAPELAFDPDLFREFFGNFKGAGMAESDQEAPA